MLGEFVLNFSTFLAKFSSGLVATLDKKCKGSLHFKKRKKG